MSRHLSPEEFVDAIDGALQGKRHEHLEHCAECRQELDALGALMRDVQSSDQAPSPSPLFWDHLPGRVVSAATLAPERTARSGWRFAWPAVAAVSALAILLALPLLRRSITPAMPDVLHPIAESAPPSIETPSAEAVAGLGRVAALEGPLTDETSPAARRSWNRMVTAGRGVPADDVLGVTPMGPGTAGLIEDLSQRELQEFARLLRAQMGGLQ